MLYFPIFSMLLVFVLVIVFLETKLFFQPLMKKELCSKNSEYDKSLLSIIHSKHIISERALKLGPEIPRILIITYFRSGSSFLGDLLSQNNGSFYSFEPLMFMSEGVRIHEEKTEEAFKLIDDIFRCKFKKSSKYVKLLIEKRWMLKWNKFLWMNCSGNMFKCLIPYTISKVCRRSEAHIMKLNRINMRYLYNLWPLIEDLNVHVVFNVRDPRGIINSRNKLNWRQINGAESVDIKHLCSEMRDDFDVFLKFKAKYPDKFSLIKYEELSFHPLEKAEWLYNRIGIPFSSKIKNFLETHTKASLSNEERTQPYGTERDSKLIAQEWIKTLQPNVTLQAREFCGDVLKNFGYKII